MCRQTTCKQAWRVVSPKIRCPLATHLHKHTQKYAAPALNSIHSRVWNYFQLIFHAAYFPDRFLFKSSGLNWKKLKSPCVAPANNECMFCSFLKQSAKAWRPTMMKKKNKGGVRRVGWGGELQKKNTTSKCRSPKKKFKPSLWNGAKRTTGACRLPSPSGPRSFTHCAVNPQPPLCSPEASMPAQMFSCLCGAAIKAAGLHVHRVSRGGQPSPKEGCDCC